MADTTDTNAEVWKSDQQISNWLATAEDRERRYAYPRHLLAELLPFGEHDSFTFVDLGAGTGAATRAVLDRYPAAQAVLVDFSPQMMEEGAKALAPFDGRYRYVAFDLAHGGGWPDDIPTAADAVISSLSVHHLPDERKRQLFEEIRAHLAPGGWYLNFDPVKAEDPAVEAVWERVNDRRDPEAPAKRANRTHEEHLRWENHVRYMIPLAPQLQWLRMAGFEAVDVYWKELEYVIYGGRVA